MSFYITSSGKFQSPTYLDKNAVVIQKWWRHCNLDSKRKYIPDNDILLGYITDNDSDGDTNTGSDTNTDSDISVKYMKTSRENNKCEISLVIVIIALIVINSFY